MNTHHHAVLRARFDRQASFGENDAWLFSAGDGVSSVEAIRTGLGTIQLDSSETMEGLRIRIPIQVHRHS